MSNGYRSSGDVHQMYEQERLQGEQDGQRKQKFLESAWSGRFTDEDRDVLGHIWDDPSLRAVAAEAVQQELYRRSWEEFKNQLQHALGQGVQKHDGAYVFYDPGASLIYLQKIMEDEEDLPSLDLPESEDWIGKVVGAYQLAEPGARALRFMPETRGKPLSVQQSMLRPGEKMASLRTLLTVFCLQKMGNEYHEVDPFFKSWIRCRDICPDSGLPLLLRLASGRLEIRFDDNSGYRKNVICMAAETP